MNRRRVISMLLATAAGVGALIANSPAASAHVICDSGEFFRVTQHTATFNQVDAAQLINTKSGTATLSVQVGVQHTSSRSFSASITTSVEGGFWVFAKASASATAGVTIATSSTMYASYTATVSVPAHSTRTVKFGFRRYNQYIQRYHLYNNTISSCARHVDQAGWVNAPYMKTFIVS